MIVDTTTSLYHKNFQIPRVSASSTFFAFFYLAPIVLAVDLCLLKQFCAMVVANAELVQILNRVGAVACLDTCNRLATEAVQQRVRVGIRMSLKPGLFSVASIDNIDILQIHQMVLALDKTRSWHGTSVQCVQPLPETGMLSIQEVENTSNPDRHLNLRIQK